MANVVTWFEIPVANFDRALKFYSTIFGVEIDIKEMEGLTFGMFPFDQKKEVGGAIVKGKGYEPGPSGGLLYLNGGNDLNSVLSKVEKSGGKIAMPKTKIPVGYSAIFFDTEGNKVALYSPN